MICERDEQPLKAVTGVTGGSRNSTSSGSARRVRNLCERVEKLAARNMTRSSRGTAEAPGTNTAQKTGLSRKLLGLAPAEQTAILIRAGERTGTRIELVNARYTSQRCNACRARPHVRVPCAGRVGRNGRRPLVGAGERYGARTPYALEPA